jgi:hypothetical protein
MYSFMGKKHLPLPPKKRVGKFVLPRGKNISKKFVSFYKFSDIPESYPFGDLSHTGFHSSFLPTSAMIGIEPRTLHMQAFHH